tara:strand:- start:1117 stop:1326 length:210 start_codon:yes stop_codon:yes gene_type:complete
MFDWFWNILGYETNHSERKKWVNKKIEEENLLEKGSNSKTQQENLLEKGVEGEISPPTPPRKSKRNQKN